MIGQIPSNMLLTRVRPGIYLSGCALIWSALSAVTAGVKNAPQLLAVRFLLGIMEAPFFPGVRSLAPAGAHVLTDTGNLSDLLLVYPKGDCSPHYQSLHCPVLRNGLLWSYRRWDLCQYGGGHGSRGVAVAVHH